MAIATVPAYFVVGVAMLRNAGLDWIHSENLRNWVAYDLVRKDLFGDAYLPAAPWALANPWGSGPRRRLPSWLRSAHCWRSLRIGSAPPGSRRCGVSTSS